MINKMYPKNWRSYSFRAMGCEMSVWLETADYRTAIEAFIQVETLFMLNERALSRFRPESELSRLNALSGQWVAVSDLLWEVLSLALQMAAETNGRFDPTMLNALEQHGYTISFDWLTDSFPNRYAPIQVSFPGQWTAIELDERLQTVYLPKGVRIDLGGIAKGYTAQQAIELLRPHGPCLVDAGGDLAAGDGPEGHRGWPVAVAMPWNGEEAETGDLFSSWLSNGSLATSGIDYRKWQRDGRTAHHLIDPATGQPAATDGLTATVLANNAGTAEAWATATLVAGSKTGMDALLDAELAGLMVCENGQILATPQMDKFIHPIAA